MMDDAFMRSLVMIRRRACFPFPITSAYRFPDYNAQVSSTGRTGPHTTGRAVDIALSRDKADAADKLATALAAITGRGFKLLGESRFIHWDDLPDAPGRPRPTIWSY